MIDLVERAAATSPDQLAITPAEGATQRQTPAGRRAGVASGLRHRNITRFAIVEPDAAWAMRLLIGAAIAGAEPCQYQADIAINRVHRTGQSARPFDR